MSHYDETLNTWNKVAQLYQEKFMDLDLYDESYALFSSAIEKQNASILEIGCGPGNISRYLLKLHQDFIIHGIDFAPNMIELAKVNIPKATFEVRDARDISQLSKTFDGIIAGFCLPYLSGEESKQLILDANSLLNENGILYLSFVEGDPAQSGLKVSSTGDRAFFHYHELSTLTRAIVEAGFENPLCLHVNYGDASSKQEIHTILIAKKL
jgi:cyclopropane fatty-acyl-phospholipid synthase-like methyltransferase